MQIVQVIHPVFLFLTTRPSSMSQSLQGVYGGGTEEERASLSSRPGHIHGARGLRIGSCIILDRLIRFGELSLSAKVGPFGRLQPSSAIGARICVDPTST